MYVGDIYSEHMIHYMCKGIYTLYIYARPTQYCVRYRSEASYVNLDNMCIFLIYYVITNTH